MLFRPSLTRFSVHAAIFCSKTWHYGNNSRFWPGSSLGHVRVLIDKFFWVALCRFWPGWRSALLIVEPSTVVRWHHKGFKLYWKWISRHRIQTGRKPLNKELRGLIFGMVAQNPIWGAPRIHGELKMLGFDVSERTILRWMRKAPRNPDASRRWAAFLNNRRAAIAAMDFFTVPTLTFEVLYCLFVITLFRMLARS